MDFSGMSDGDLLYLYGECLKTMRERGLIHSKNVTGDLGEFLAIDYYGKTKGLPKLQPAPPDTKNIDAVSVKGDRYSIKCVTTGATGIFHGIPKDADAASIKPLFEYVLIVKLNENYQLEQILEMDWDTFFRQKRWNSRWRAHYLPLTKKLTAAAKVIYTRDGELEKREGLPHERKSGVQGSTAGGNH